MYTNSTCTGKRGFTLIELMVSVSLFVVVMMISTGTLLALVDANRQAQSLKSVTDNLNFAVESISRTLSTGYDYDCEGGGDCTSGGTSISFKSDRGCSVEYYFDEQEQSIRRDITAGTDPSCIHGDLRMTSPEMDIVDLVFFVGGTERGGVDDEQPWVRIAIRGRAGDDPATQTVFDIQTTVTQRLLDDID